MRREQRKSVRRLLNGLTALFLSATLVVIGLTAALLTGALPPPAAFAPRRLAPLRALALPTLTPSDTPTQTLTPSLTPSWTATPSLTPSPSATHTPSQTASATLTFTVTPTPSLTFTATPSPTVTQTPTPTLTPTSTATATATFTPTAAFPFMPLQTRFTRFEGRTDCDFQGISGTALGLQGERLSARVGIQAQVIGNNFAQRIPIESDSIYGWVIQVGERPQRATYRVQLLSREDVILSPVVSIQFDGMCERNLAQVDFLQIRPF